MLQQREINRLPTLLLDENIPRKVLVTLRQAGYTAMRVYDVGLRGQPDTAIFAYARARRLLIITFDTDYLNQMAFPPLMRVYSCCARSHVKHPLPSLLRRY